MTYSHISCFILCLKSSRGDIDDQYAPPYAVFCALGDCLPAENVQPWFVGSPPPFNTMSDEEVEALLVEMEPDIRAAERDMREIELLEVLPALGGLSVCSFLFIIIGTSDAKG